MQEDFHYYATYAAAYLAGYSHTDSITIAYSAQFVDCCTATLLKKIKGPLHAATTQLKLELADARTDFTGLQNITRIWSSFHFLPGNLHAKIQKCSLSYLRKYQLLCNVNGDLLIDTVKLAKGKSLQACGVAMHVLADTWAHRYFAGTPSLVMNNATDFYNLHTKKPIHFTHNPVSFDDINREQYTNTLYQSNENNIMNLGHGRAGHLPDYSFMQYSFLPAYGGYKLINKDNPSDYYYAFCQMIYALQYLRGEYHDFEKNTYSEETIHSYRNEIMEIITKPQLDANKDWKEFGEKLSGEIIDDFCVSRYEEEYQNAPNKEKDCTFLGKFILSALAQKSMVTSRIFCSGNLLAGYAIDFKTQGFKGIRDFKKIIHTKEEL